MVVQVPGIVLSLERNEANGQMACCIALDEARPLAEKFVCVCVCVCVCVFVSGDRNSDGVCWHEQGVGR